MTFFELAQRPEGWRLTLKGRWTIRYCTRITAALAAVPLRALPQLSIDGSGLGRIDTAGVLLLKDFCAARGLSLSTIALDGFTPDYAAFVRTIWELPVVSCPGAPHVPVWRRTVETAGRRVTHAAQETRRWLVFTGRVATGIGYLLRHPRQFRLAATVRHMDEAGVRAIPIVSLLAFLISIVLAYQGATQLKNFGADIFTVDLTVISILREMGVLLTAIIVAGRSGSAFAAEIGVMKLREEINALHTFGLNPYHILVIPRVLALTLMLPLLTIIADLTGLLGTAVMTYLLLDISFLQFVTRVGEFLQLNTVVVGLVKAPVFGLLIALIGTYQGMQVSGSAESVGRLTTVSVVQSIFLVMFADALFSILFSEFGV